MVAVYISFGIYRFFSSREKLLRLMLRVFRLSQIKLPSHTRGCALSSKRHPNQGGRSGPACRRTVLCHRSGNSSSSNSHPCPNRRRRRGSKALAKRRRAARRRKRRGPSLSRKRAIMQLRRGTLQRLRVSSLRRRRRRRRRLRGVLSGEDWRLLPLLLLPRCDHQQQQRHCLLLEVAMYRRD